MSKFINQGLCVQCALNIAYLPDNLCLPCASENHHAENHDDE